MALKCFHLNVFCTLIILYSLTDEAFAQTDVQFVGLYDVVEFNSQYSNMVSPLERTLRQVSQPLEKKNDAPPQSSVEKFKVTKKPTALDSKPTISSTDAEEKQKLKIGVKKDPVSTKAVASQSFSEVHDLEQSHINGEVNQESVHSEPTHSNFSENKPFNATLPTAPTELLSNSTPVPDLTNITLPDSDLQASRFLEVNLNETLKEHGIQNPTEDHHLYYNSSILYDADVFQHYWVDMDKMSDTRDILSNSHRRAVTVKLNFEFPFYGHAIGKIIIATGGFLYTGEYVHSWLSVTQYIAPLMANFDTASSNHSSIKYIDNGTAFTVQWENVVLQDKPDEGNFTFQCTLFKNGNIVFAYKHISIAIDNTTNSQHPIKVGLSDAYIIDRTIFLVRRKTIYEYHRVKFGRDVIRNETVILLNALETCLGMKDCRSCVTEIPNFECNWCSNRCSNGMDRYRQDWLAKGCLNKRKLTADECSAEEVPLSIKQSQTSAEKPSDSGNEMNIGIAGIMGILFAVCLALGIVVWLFYAYRNPHTPAGQFLIRYRPSQWSWRRGEARYTAATIHM